MIFPSICRIFFKFFTIFSVIFSLLGLLLISSTIYEIIVIRKESKFPIPLVSWLDKHFFYFFKECPISCTLRSLFTLMAGSFMMLASTNPQMTSDVSMAFAPYQFCTLFLGIAMVCLCGMTFQIALLLTSGLQGST